MGENAFAKKYVCQVGIVVKDIKKAQARFSEVFGIPAGDIIRINYEDTEPTIYRGESVRGKALLAFFDMENIVIEYIEPGDDASTWAEFLEEHGNGIHHIAFKTRHQMDEYIAALEKEGIACVQKGGRYAYMDATRDLGCIMELLDYD